MRYSDLTYTEIRTCAQSNWLVVIPTGCTEQQGPHLPVDWDTWFAERVTLAAAEHAAAQHNVHALVLPALPFGPTPEHRNFGSGYIDLPAPLHDAVLEAVLTSLVAQGFRRIVIWRGCGGHDLRALVAHFNATHADRATVTLPEMPYHDLWCAIGDPNVPGGHADSFTTSLALHLRPDAVRRDLITTPHNTPLDWDDPNLDFAQHSDTGVIGDPTHASAELGAQLWTALVERAAEILKTAATT